MKLKTYKDKTDLLDDIYNFSTALQPAELHLLFQIPPKSKVVLTDRALLCYTGTVVKTFHPRDYIAVQLLIDIEQSNRSPGA